MTLSSQTKQTDNKEVDPARFIKAYQFHGLDVTYQPDKKESLTTCIFCGRARKFSINVATGKGRCFVCAEGSVNGGLNLSSFLKSLHKLSMEHTSSDDYEDLRESRKLLSVSTLKAWGVCKSYINDEWLIPGFSVGHKDKSPVLELRQIQLYKWVRDHNRGKNLLYATTGINHGLFGLHLFDVKKHLTYQCEGPWDAMALWEVLKQTKHNPDDNSYTRCGKQSESLLSNTNVIAVPGCGTFSDKWMPLHKGREVVLCYDSDHPRMAKDDRPIPSAGFAGVKRVGTMLMTQPEKERPESVSYLCWGDAGYDPSLKDGYDLRDFFENISQDTKDVKSVKK